MERKSKKKTYNQKGKINANNLVKISYNPYTYEVQIEESSLEIRDNMQIKLTVKKNRDKALHCWYKELIQAMYKDFNSKIFELIFDGRDEEFADIEEEIKELNEKDWKIELKHIKREKDNSKLLTDLEAYLEEVVEKAPEELKKELLSRNVVKEFETAKNNEAYVSVIATMSSGKSTLINAILEEELLPSKNEACTATVTRIKDNDEFDSFKVKVEDLEGKTICGWQEATSEFLENVNEKGNEKGLNIYMEGNIPGISSKEMKLVLIDTPGPNNSQNEAHKEATYRFIKDNEKNPLVLYVMNASQHGTDDDAKLLREISDIIKANGKQAEERFIFALNKIDCFDPEKESIEKLIENNKKYLKEFGIENPKIFPLSAEAAKLDRLNINGKRLSRNQNSNLNNFRNNFPPDAEDGYQGIDTIKYASISSKIKEKLYVEAENEPSKALINYSGIIAIEKYIDSYINKYAKTQKIKDSIGTLKKIIDKSYNELKTIHGRTEEELKVLQSQVNLLQNTLKTQGKEEVEKCRRKISEIESGSEELDRLNIKIEDLFHRMFEKFNNSKITPSRAEGIIRDAIQEIENLSINLKTTVESTIRDKAVKKSEEILNIIREYFENMMRDSDLDSEVKLVIEDIFELEIPSSSNLMRGNTYTEEEFAGEEFSHYKSTSKWWNPFSWGSKEAVYKSVYKNVEYVDLKKAFSQYINPLKTPMRQGVVSSQEMLEEKIEEVKENSLHNLNYIEKNVETKIRELDLKLGNKNKTERDKELQKKSIDMIINYKERLDKILEI